METNPDEIHLDDNHSWLVKLDKCRGSHLPIWQMTFNFNVMNNGNLCK